MDEAIDERRGHNLVAKDRAPLFKAFVGRQHGRRVLVAARHQLKEEHCAGPADWKVANLVDHEQRGMREDFETRLQATRGLRFLQRRDQIGERAVVHASSALRGSDRQANREMGFADPWWAQEDDVFPPLDEAELVKTLHLLATERRLEGEIKLGEPLDRGQSTGAHGGLQASVVAELNLRPEQLLDRLGGRERRAIDAVQNRVEGLKGPRHVQIGEHLPQTVATGWGGAFHASPPVRRAYT